MSKKANKYEDFNKNVMLANIISSDIPHKEKILRFVR